MQQNQLESIRVQLEREKQASEERMKVLDHKLNVWQAEREHEMKMEELRLKYHVQTSTEGIEARKLGDTPERADRFEKISNALLEAIGRKRAGLPKPPGGVA